MAEETKTYVFGQDGNNSMLPYALSNGMGNGWGGGILGFLLGAMFGGAWGGGGFGYGGNGGGAYVANALNNDAGRSLIMQGIQGNATAISQLANTLHTDTTSIQNALYSLSNIIQAGNANMSAQFAQCCCDNKLLSTQQGYENRIATMEQTNQLGAQADRNTKEITDAIASQTTAMTKEFCDVREREMQDKIDTLTAMNNNLRSQIDNANQTAQIQGYVASAIAPIKSDVEAIKATLPTTVNVPYNPITAVPTPVLYGMGYAGFGAGYGNGLWN